MSSPSSFGSGAFGTSALGTSPFYNCKELIDNVLYATGHSNPALETSKRAALVMFMNNIYQEVCLGREWPWMKATYDFRLSAPYSTGSATATQGSDTLTGTGTLWDANLSPKNIFFFSDSRIIYHVASVESPTSLTLETDFSEDDQTEGGYTVAKNQYKLPKETDYLLQFVCNEKLIVPVSEEELRIIQQRNPTKTGRPEFYSPVRRDTDDDFTYIEVWPAPDQYYQCHIDYKVRILKLEDNEDMYPIIPDRYRSVMFYGMLYQLFQYLRKTDEVANTYKIYKDFLNRMENDYHMTDGRVTMMPARNYLARRRRLYRMSYTLEEFASLDGDV